MARFPINTQAQAWPARQPRLTILKPLCGDEPALEACLRSFCAAAWPSVQLVFGARDRDDPALAVVERLKRAFPTLDLAVVIDARTHGINRKVDNLINMMRVARHDLIAVSDSDVRVTPQGLARAVAPFRDRRVGATTCLYHAAPRADWPSALGAQFIDGWFLSSAMVDAGMRPVSYCFGPLSVVRRRALQKIGGFAALANHLADDYMLGKLVDQAGYRVVLAPTTVATVVAESWRTLFAHELRWARTVRAVKPSEHVMSVVMHALPLSALSLAGPWPVAAVAIGLPLALRVALYALTRHRFGLGGPAHYWLLPLREVFCFAIWCAALLGRDVVWRDRRFRVDRDGLLLPCEEAA